jgi:hypothetical protein
MISIHEMMNVDKLLNLVHAYLLLMVHGFQDGLLVS